MLFANPSDEFESSVELEVGDYDHRKIKAMVNAPISDSLSLRIAGLMLERNGFSENLFPGREGEDLDGRDITSWRFTLRGEISDNTSANLPIGILKRMIIVLESVGKCVNQQKYLHMVVTQANLVGVVQQDLQPLVVMFLR